MATDMPSRSDIMLARSTNIPAMRGTVLIASIKTTLCPSRSYQPSSIQDGRFAWLPASFIAALFDVRQS
jgi:hypothetical protein